MNQIFKIKTFQEMKQNSMKKLIVKAAENNFSNHNFVPIKALDK